MNKYYTVINEQPASYIDLANSRVSSSLGNTL